MRLCACGWFSSYDRVQCCALGLLYLQITCAIIGSIGTAYGGVSVANLAIALFALVAIESGSQNLGRAYAVFLFCTLLLDISWFILYSREIWKISKDANAGAFLRVSVRTVFFMEVAGFCMRFLSAFLWMQMYRLGPSRDLTGLYEHADFGGGFGTVGFITPLASPAPSRQVSVKEDVVGGSIYNPVYYSSLFEPSGNLNKEGNETNMEEERPAFTV